MIDIHSPVLRAQINPRGAALLGLWSSDFNHSLVLGSPDTKTYDAELLYSGAIVGPVANRVGNASLRLNGTDWRMDANEGDTCLHSGRTGLHALDWTVTEQDKHSVTLEITLPHGQGGLPGDRRIAVTYCVQEDAALALTFTATTDRETVMNLAHHPYWNLDGANDIGTHQLKIDADTYLPVDAKTLPTGEIRPVAGTEHDFRQLRPVPVDLNIDENFCLAHAARTRTKAAATLIGSNGCRLQIHTTEPGLQVYNGSGLAHVDGLLHDAQPLRPFAGIALEPQRWPNTEQHPNFPSIRLLPGEEYRQNTVYRFSRQL